MGSNVDWIRWGERDPLWGVAAWAGKQKGGPNAWTGPELYACGEGECEFYLKVWSRHGLAGHSSCLELGCGTGRLTVWLARRFARVHAVDVSPGMIEYAKRNVVAENVRFHLNDGASVPLDDGSVEAVFSAFVFQHFEWPCTGLRYFREIHRVLAPGGVAMIHLPVYQWPARSGSTGRLGRIEKVVMRGLHAGRMAASRAWAGFCRWRGQAVMRGICYDGEELFSFLESLGFTEVEVCLMGVSGLSWAFCQKRHVSRSDAPHA